MNAIHLSTAQHMLLRPDAVDLDIYTADGRLLHLANCISLKYNFYSGTRTVKILSSNQIRTVRDVCIARINSLDVFL